MTQLRVSAHSVSVGLLSVVASDMDDRHPLHLTVRHILFPHCHVADTQMAVLGSEAQCQFDSRAPIRIKPVNHIERIGQRDMPHAARHRRITQHHGHVPVDGQTNIVTLPYKRTVSR
ncbi:hypothetical protein WK94_20510 [Burkholderia ubonensis]|nr:hypothetical protein WK94_20510 [Burkholderia ubonensis]